MTRLLVELAAASLLAVFLPVVFWASAARSHRRLARPLIIRLRLAGRVAVTMAWSLLRGKTHAHG